MDLWWSRLTDYHPSTGQWPIHESSARVRLVAGGERGGKSMSTAMDTLPHLLDCDLVWIVAKDYNLARREFEYLFQALNAGGFVKASSMPQGPHSPWRMTLVTGCKIYTITAADEVKLAAEAPDIILMVEAAQQSFDIYLRLRRRTAEKRGRLLMSGTFENSEDWYAELWEAWQHGGPEGEQSFSLPTWTNTAIFPLGEADPELQQLRRVLGEDAYNERFGGVPTPPSTVVFPEFSYEKHVTLCPFDPERPVQVAIDPGFNGAYAVLALQWDNQFVYAIDEVYERRLPAREVIRATLTRPWAKNVNRFDAGVIDIAGTQHHAMESHAEIWAASRKKGGAGWQLTAKFVPIEDGAERLRTFLRHPIHGIPRIFYNAETTRQSQREYRRYRFGQDKDGRPQREHPIDRDNHAIKAAAYWLVNRYGWTGKKHRRTTSLEYGTPSGRSRHPLGRLPPKRFRYA